MRVSTPLAILRQLRAPLGALAAMLVLAGAVPAAMAATSLCLAVERAADGEGVDAPDCPFCSASFASFVPPPTAGATPRPGLAFGPVVARVALAPLPRGPPVGGRAPPLT